MLKTVFAIALVACLVAGCAAPAARVPAQLQPAAGERPMTTARAVGVQIYECRAVKDKAPRFEWAFVAPEADLFDGNGTWFGRHDAGPQWEALDGSRVQGTVAAREPAPSADAIPWLLLTTKSTGPDGTFSKVTSILRVYTLGGNAPKAGCAQVNAGAAARVPYSADYVFFTR